MENKKLLKAKGFMIFNIALSCLIAGFAIGIFTFSCSTGKSQGNVAFAEDTGSKTTASGNMLNLQNSFRGVVQKVLDVVVKIDVVDKVKRTVDGNNQSPFDFFLNPFNRNRRGDQQNQDNPQVQPSPPEEMEFDQPGLGSGVIVQKDGKKVYVLTNDHVAGTADDITITLHDQRSFKAKLIGHDERKDLALVMFETDEQVPVADLGNSDDLYVGDWALAVGNPFGLESTVTAGIISAMGRQGGGPGGKNISDFIQTDAAINPGNSGGALVNINGQVIGINTWIASSTGSYAGYGFAIPINNARKAISDFIKLGKVEYGWLGVSIADVANEYADAMKIKGITGAFVFNVFKGSPADKAGILPGDYITQLNGNKVKDASNLTNMIGDLPVNKTYDGFLIRQGKEQKLSLKIEVRKSEDEISKSNKNIWPGFAATMLTDKLRKDFKIEDNVKGVIVSDVDAGTPAQIAGINRGDVITKIGNKAVSSLLEFYAGINDAGSGELMLKLWRNGVELIIGLVR